MINGIARVLITQHIVNTTRVQTHQIPLKTLLCALRMRSIQVDSRLGIIIELVIFTKIQNLHLFAFICRRTNGIRNDPSQRRPTKTGCALARNVAVIPFHLIRFW